MLKNPVFIKKIKYLHVVTYISCALFLAACDNTTRTKNVQRYPKNAQPGSGNQPKPTPETGLHTPGYAALNMIAIQRTARALDIVLNRDKSVYVHTCQKLTTAELDNNSVAITLLSPRQNCSWSKNKNSKENWFAQETYTVTYDDGQRGNSTRIKTIKKNEDSRATIINRSVPKNETNINISLAAEKIDFTKGADGQLEFTYRSGLTFTETQTRRTQKPNLSSQNNGRSQNNNQNNNRRENENTRRNKNINLITQEEEIVRDQTLALTNELELAEKTKITTKFVQADFIAAGSVVISNSSQLQWTLTQMELKDYERYTNDRLNINTNFTLAANQATKNMATICGLPIGYFSAHQVVTINEQQSTYTPQFIIDPAGIINTPGYNVKFQTKTCQASTRDGLRGFQDLIESILLAEKITNQPMPNAAPEPLRNVVHEEAFEENE